MKNNSECYIVTFANVSQGYYPLLDKNENVINLGFGKKWEGFYSKVKAVIDFCQQVKPYDIVCFVDGFDSVIIADDPKEEIKSKFWKKECDILFSTDLERNSNVEWYIQNRVFGNCRNEFLNSGLYVGFAEKIIRFWRDINPNTYSDQKFATYQCEKLENEINVKIDCDRVIFYNYMGNEYDHTYEHQRLIVPSSKDNKKLSKSTIISAPANKNMMPILLKLGYKKLQIPTFEYSRFMIISRAKKIFFAFWLEIVSFLLIIIVILSQITLPSKT